MPSRILRAGERTLCLDEPQIMGILNVTPDSFSDGGNYMNLDAALAQAEKMVTAGAAIIDIGGESTRPGAQLVSIEEEISRVIPVVKAVVKHFPQVLVSVDTSSLEVITQAADCGAHIWNDIRALTRPHAIEIAAQYRLGVCLMHMQNTPQNMQDNPYYDQSQGGVVAAVKRFLQDRATLCEEYGISPEHIILDPGFGFGKSVSDNYSLLKHLGELTADTSYHLMAALSRKSMIGAVTGEKEPARRVVGSVVAAFYALEQGAQLLRVHDVAEMVEAKKIFLATREAL